MADKLVHAAVEALPTLHAAVARDVLVEDLALLDELERQIAIVDHHIERLLPDTPYAVMRSVPGLAAPASRAYTARLRERGEPGAVITIALAHRATKLAFAMVRDQVTFDPDHWEV